MKQRLCVAVCLIVTLAACQKNKTERVLATGIQGRWELRTISGQIIYQYAPGNGNGLYFTSDHYQTFIDSRLVKSGTYALQPDATAERNICLVVRNNEFGDRIVYDGVDSVQKVFVQLHNDTLTFVSGCFAYDAGSFQIYVRQNENK